MRISYSSFQSSICQNELDLVQRIFSRLGAYGRFKALLEDRDLLKNWYDFENQRDEEALLEWARENKVELEPQGPVHE